MKKSVIRILSLLIIVLHFQSCTTLLEMAEQPETPKKQGKSFIELKDGTIVNGKTITYPQPTQIDFSTIDFFKRQVRDDDWIGIDDRKVPIETIYGFQDNAVYRALHLNRVLLRLEKGKLNLYSFERDKKNLSGSNMFKEIVYVYEKSKGNFKAIDDRLDLFYESIADNKEASNLCKELFPYLRFSQMESNGEKLRRVVALYNQ